MSAISVALGAHVAFRDADLEDPAADLGRHRDLIFMRTRCSTACRLGTVPPALTATLGRRAAGGVVVVEHLCRGPEVCPAAYPVWRVGRRDVGRGASRCCAVRC